MCQSQPSSDKQVEQRLLAEVQRVCLKEGEKTWAGRKEMNELWEPKPEASLREHISKWLTLSNGLSIGFSI